MARQSTLNVSLTASLREYVQSKVDSGRYESASEVIRDSLRALQERERAVGSFWVNVREKVTVARRQVAQRKVLDGETAMDEIVAGLDSGDQQTRSRRRKKSR